MATVADDRQRALGAAGRLLTTRGLRDLKVESVLREAGLSTRAFYRHFGNKHDLVRALIEQSSHDVAERTRAALEANPDPVAALHDWVVVMLDSGSSERPSLDAALIWHSLEARRLYSDGIEQAVALVLEPLVLALRRVQERHPHVRPRLDGVAFLMLTRAVQAQLVAPGNALGHEEAVATVWSVIYRTCVLEPLPAE
ncbi:MAG: betI 17 [Frankiales bacterium]|nr:betI 17 [Frankiales bacterium]